MSKGIKRPVTLPMIERFLRLTGWGPSRFGRAAVGDHQLLRALRAGGELGPKREPVVAQFIEDHVEAAATQARKLKELMR